MVVHCQKYHPVVTQTLMSVSVPKFFPLFKRESKFLINKILLLRNLLPCHKQTVLFRAFVSERVLSIYLATNRSVFHFNALSRLSSASLSNFLNLPLFSRACNMEALAATN